MSSENDLKCEHFSGFKAEFEPQKDSSKVPC